MCANGHQDFMIDSAFSVAGSGQTGIDRNRCELLFRRLNNHCNWCGATSGYRHTLSTEIAHPLLHLQKQNSLDKIDIVQTSAHLDLR